MRLIDADELKKNSYRDSWNVAVVTVDEIDNAPTVEPCYQITSCLDCKNYDKEKYNCPRFCEVIREIAKENQRPQGEWIKQYGKSYELITDEGVLVGEFTKCPKCQYDKARGSKFCPNCGADMRGGAE